MVGSNTNFQKTRRKKSAKPGDKRRKTTLRDKRKEKRHEESL